MRGDAEKIQLYLKDLTWAEALIVVGGIVFMVGAVVAWVGWTWGFIVWLYRLVVGG